jgi:hypothetical protein
MIAEDARYKSLTAVIMLANHLCSREGLSLTGRTPAAPLDNSILKQLKLGHDEVSELHRTLAARKQTFVSFFPA